MYKMYKKKH